MSSVMKFPHLFSPLVIRGKTYRNRIITGPTLFAHAVYIDDIRENVYRMCEKRAAGGAAEVSTGEICVNFEEGIPRDSSLLNGAAASSDTAASTFFGKFTRKRFISKS